MKLSFPALSGCCASPQSVKPSGRLLQRFVREIVGATRGFHTSGTYSPRGTCSLLNTALALPFTSGTLL